MCLQCCDNIRDTTNVFFPKHDWRCYFLQARIFSLLVGGVNYMLLTFVCCTELKKRFNNKGEWASMHEFIEELLVFCHSLWTEMFSKAIFIKLVVFIQILELLLNLTDSLCFFVMQYKNVRPDYLKNIWKVINWKYANDVYENECPWTGTMFVKAYDVK